MKIAVLFDGAGLARLGLEQAGHECTGYELDPWKVHLGQMVGSGHVIHADVAKLKRSQLLFNYEAIWASPPCARRTSCIKDLTRADGLRNPEFQHDYLAWCLTQKSKWPNPVWIENVTIQGGGERNGWGFPFNAAQFLKDPIRNLTVEECAYHQGFKVPRGWWEVPPSITPAKWRHMLYHAIGDGVPVYMAKAFGAAYK